MEDTIEIERKITEIIIKLWLLRYHVSKFLSIEIVEILAIVLFQELPPTIPAPYCSRVLIRYINFFLDPRGKLIRWESNWFICFCPPLVYLPGTASYHPIPQSYAIADYAAIYLGMFVFIRRNHRAWLGAILQDEDSQSGLSRIYIWGDE